MLYKWQVVWETRGRSSQLTQLREDREASQRRWPWSKDLKHGWNYAREREQHVKVIAAEKYDPMRKKGYFWMSEAENPCRVWARGVEANRWVEGLVWHAEDVLEMPARVGDRGILSQCCGVHSRHMLCGEQIDNIYQKYKCIAPPTQQWHT